MGLNSHARLKSTSPTESHERNIRAVMDKEINQAEIAMIEPFRGQVPKFIVKSLCHSSF